MVILQAQHKNLNMHGTRLAGSFPASVHPCLSLLLNHTNVQQETVLTDKYSLISQNSAVIFGFQLMRKHVLAFSKDGK